MHFISFRVSRRVDLLITFPDLFLMVTAFVPFLFLIRTSFTLVRPLPFLNSECVCTELYSNILLYRESLKKEQDRKATNGCLLQAMIHPL